MNRQGFFDYMRQSFGDLADLPSFDATRATSYRRDYRPAGKYEFMEVSWDAPRDAPAEITVVTEAHGFILHVPLSTDQPLIERVEQRGGDNYPDLRAGMSLGDSVTTIRKSAIPR